MSDLPRDRPGEPNEPDESRRPERRREGNADPELAPGVRWSDRELPEDYGAQWENVDDHGDRPKIGEMRITDERRDHMLDGDATGGGHRHGTGRPGKTEFPEDWDDDRAVEHILDVARDPADKPQWQSWNSRWLVHGEREEVGLYAVVLPDGRVWTAWPTDGSPGVIKNPEKPSDG